ncbi:unnamed product [Ostreococcus tauri]|uniref:Unnamed product n=1 Tax=Ostreococcus tauri TaxID=70448 RepID=A0A090MEH7_OSTTA|nr:unnamed product [Ostreococcus tauri]CEG01362.1 unnamed product [Ostreococcus tauri]|eukprot:XP_003080637.2 unnamed product [Ostreococcus tauri]
MATTMMRGNDDVDAVRRRRWGVAAPVASSDATATAHRGFVNHAAAVEDPGECARGGRRGVLARWTGGGGDDGGDDDARARAPGGATCHNRFIHGRGARDPFAPASASARLMETSGTGDAHGAGAGERVGGAGEAREAPFARAGRGRRLVEGVDCTRAVTYAYDRGRGMWTARVADGDAADVGFERAARGDVDDAARDGSNATEVTDNGGDIDDDDEEGVEMRARAREARVRLYQAPYEAAERIFAETRARREPRVARVVASSRRHVHVVNDSYDAHASTSLDQRSMDKEMEDSEEESTSTIWIPVAREDGARFWIEAAADVSPTEQLASWCRGDVPWPTARALDLGKDRTGLPRGAPGPAIEDADAIASIQLHLRRLHEENVRAAATAAEVTAATESAPPRSLTPSEHLDLLRQLALARSERDRLRDKLRALGHVDDADDLS